jgi:short-subunit dehydrogenase
LLHRQLKQNELMNGAEKAMRSIQESVIVITGASSGIGRATALTLAQQQAKLVLAARRETALQEVAETCQAAGATAIAVPTDVTQEDQVQALAQKAIDTFGRIDVWINNAAVSLFAKFEDAPTDAFRRVIETNLFGYIYGARAAMKQFRQQSSGNLINVASIVGLGAQPYTSAYVISKHGIRAMAECLRMELHLDNASNIDVCTVLPATIDTPIFQQAANYTGRTVKAMDPVYAADDVADAIVNLVKKPQREVIVGAVGYLMALQSTLTPDLYERMMAEQVDKNHLSDQPTIPSDGNLFEPMPEHAKLSGGWSHTGELSEILSSLMPKT